MRLIDADALLKVFKAKISAYRQIEGKHNWGDHCRIPAFEFMDALKSAKTIEAIQVVRCGDCRFYDDQYCHANKCYVHSKQYFCVFGETEEMMKKKREEQKC